MTHLISSLPRLQSPNPSRRRKEAGSVNKGYDKTIYAGTEEIRRKQSCLKVNGIELAFRQLKKKRVKINYGEKVEATTGILSNSGKRTMSYDTRHNEL